MKIEIYFIPTIMNVLKEILQLRGYTLTERQGEENEFYFNNGDKPGKVVFIQKEKANIDDLAEIFRPIVKEQMQVIIVYKTMTAPAINSFKNDIAKYFTAELIPLSKLIRNPLEHRLTPTAYRKLSVEEKKRVLKQYDCDESKMPAMAPTDVNAVLFGFVEGDMIEVTSHYNFTTKKVDMEMPPQITYRVVKLAS